MSTMIEAKT